MSHLLHYYYLKVVVDLPARAGAITPTLATTAAIAVGTADRTMRLVTITTVYRAVLTWNEWDRGRSSTVSTCRFKMFDIARTRRHWLGITSSSTATGTATWLIGQVATGEKLLFSSAKGKILTTVTTGKDTILVSSIRNHR